MGSTSPAVARFRVGSPRPGRVRRRPRREGASMLTAAQRAEFDRTGLLRLPSAIPAADTAAMRERLWRHLADTRGIVADRAGTWPRESPRRLRALRRSGVF